MEINNHTIKEAISGQFSAGILSAEESYGMLDIVVDKEVIMPLILWLKNHELFRFNFLTSLCGIHFPAQENKELGVIYHLHSLSNNIRIRLHVFLPESKPEIPSLTPVFAGANWMERETFEFYGIQFTGHPDLRIILNVEDMDYHPLRKQYPLEDSTRTDKDDKYFGR